MPWAGFVFAGVAAGAALAGAQTEAALRRLQLALAVLAVVVGAAAWWASFQPTIYPPGRSAFWGASPTFFFLRLAIVTAVLPAGVEPAAASARARSRRSLATIGAASLFAYWVHVELVYGGIAIPIKRRVPLELSVLAAAGDRLRPGPPGAGGARVGRRRRAAADQGAPAGGAAALSGTGRAAGGCAMVTGRRQR